MLPGCRDDVAVADAGVVGSSGGCGFVGGDVEVAVVVAAAGMRFGCARVEFDKTGCAIDLSSLLSSLICLSF